MSRPHDRVRRATALVVSLLLVAVMVGLVAWALLVPPVTDSRVTPLELPVDAARTSYVCPSGPGNTVGAVAAGPVTASTSLTVLGPGSASVAGSTNVASPQALPDGQLTQAGAEGTTVAVSPNQPGTQAGAVGTVTSLATSGDLRGLTVTPCQPGSAMSWIVGGSAAVGSSAQLRLTNTGSTVATAQVTMYGSTGTLPLSRGGQLAVPAGQTVNLLLEGAGAHDDRMAVSVEAEGGSLTAVLSSQSLDGETPAGVEVLAPGAGTGTELTIPAVELTEDDAQAASTAAPTDSPTAAAQATGAPSPEPEGPGVPGSTAASGSVVRVVNPASQAATVSVEVLGPEGPADLPGAQDLVIDPQAVQDVSLAGVPAGTYGVRVRADHPVAAAVRLTRAGDAYPAGSDQHVRETAWVQAQAPSQGARAALALPGQGVGADGTVAVGVGSAAQGTALGAVLAVTNVGERDSQVTLTTTDGEWTSSLPVEAGASATLDLAQAGLPEGTRVLLLEPDGGAVVAGLVLTHEVTQTDTLSVQADAGADTQAQAAQRVAGTLIAVLPLTPDVETAPSRAVVVR